MELRTLEDLRLDVHSNLWRIPPDIDLVVGVPRSGMLVASMISLALNRRLVDFAGFLEGRVFESGSTRKSIAESLPVRHALIVDDSSHSGSALASVMEQLNSARLELPSVTTCVVYGTSSARPRADIIMLEIDRPRIFEWNMLHHPGVLSDACLDIDGVLCHDPTWADNDDGPRYEEFLRNARPLHLPSHPVKALVTSRLEKYRLLTETWLKEHGVRYGELAMLDLVSAEERQRLGSHAAHKANFYSSSTASIFFESEEAQAIEIARLSGKPVISMDGPRVWEPSSFSIAAAKQRLTNPRLMARWLRRWLPARSVNSLRRLYRRVTSASGRLD